jgi:hypothetical protein
MSRRSWGIMEAFYVKHGVVSETHEFRFDREDLFQYIRRAF